MKNTSNQNYEDWWEDYSDVNHYDPGTKIRKKIIAKEIANPKYKKILDLGCGAGELLEYIHTSFPKKELFGTDVSKKALEILKKKSN